MASRADHYVWAETLVWKARRDIADHEPGGQHYDGVAEPDWTRLGFDLAAASVHATLAAAGPGVEQEVRDNEKRAAQAVGAAESSERPVTVCRCVGDLPHALGSPGCERPGMPVVEETAGTVRPKPGPPADCRCLGPDKLHPRGIGICMHNPQTRTGR